MPKLFPVSAGGGMNVITGASLSSGQTSNTAYTTIGSPLNFSYGGGVAVLAFTCNPYSNSASGTAYLTYALSGPSPITAGNGAILTAGSTANGIATYWFSLGQLRGGSYSFTLQLRGSSTAYVYYTGPCYATILG